MYYILMAKWYQREAPEGSLRALGGKGKQFEVPANLAVSVVRILHGKPEVGARAVLQARGKMKDAVAFLMEGGHLTKAQYRLIGASLPVEIPKVSRAITLVDEPLLQKVIQETADDTGDAIRRVLGTPRRRSPDPHETGGTVSFNA